MKTIKLSAKDSKIKLSIEDFNVNKIEGSIAKISGGKKSISDHGMTESTCTAGDSGCCDDNHVDDDAL